MVVKPNPYLIDDENPEWTEADFKSARPFKEVFPEFAAAMAKEQQEKAEAKRKSLSVSQLIAAE